MKGFLFQRPVEYYLETSREEWEQGDIIEGSLRLKNVGNENIEIKKVILILAHGVFKKIKAKEDGAWKVLDTLSLTGQTQLSSQEEQVYEWNFQLPTDCPITDKHGSMFLWYGDQDAESPGKIDFKVQLKSFLQSFIQSFEAQFQFKKKYEKSKTEYTEVKLVPPSSQSYPTLDHVLCLLRIHENVMDIKYTFKMKSLGREQNANLLIVKGKKREYQQTFTTDQFSLGGFPNRGCFQKAISEALEQTKPQGLL